MKTADLSDRRVIKRWAWALAALSGLLLGCWGQKSVADARTPPAAFGEEAGKVAPGPAIAALERGKSAPASTSLEADPLAAKVSFWLQAVRSGATVSFAALDAFMSANPDWPLRTVLRRRAEEALPETMPAAAVVAWFGAQPATTPHGQYRLATALLAVGERDRAAAVARAAWRRGEDFPAMLESAFLRTFNPILSAADHRERLDALLWSGRFAGARRLFPRIEPGHRALAEARTRLRLQRGDVDVAVGAVPKDLVDDPGLIYERIRWRRKNGLEMGARTLLGEVTGDPARPDLWWIERNVLARDALRLGHVSEAYRLVRNHSLVEPGDYSEAEWFAGWIALRFLREPQTAREHFLNMYRVVRFPISVARAAHWAARAGEAAGEPDFARTWDEIAASHPTTFYGRLSAMALDADSLTLPPDPQPDAEEKALFDAHDLVRAVRLLAGLGRNDTVRTFIRALAEVDPSPGWQAMTAELAAEAGGPSLGVATAKRAMRNGYALFSHAYPTIPLPGWRAGSPEPVDPALVLAMIRQESEFDLKAVSPSGARGLMQLMPGTAKLVANRIDLAYSPGRLTSDPGYNIELGRAYLSSLLQSFDGSYVLAFAAYNAGPGRVRSWLATYGDPRKGDVDIVDWIEVLPYEETRNYVQRAIENMWVYRARLDGGNRLLATDFGR